MRTFIFTKVALRYKAIYLSVYREAIQPQQPASAAAIAFTAQLRALGFCVSEELLRALSNVSIHQLHNITEAMRQVMQVGLNWAPLVKGWQTPTGESLADHFFTYVANAGKEEMPIKGTTLPCGHLIPEGTFPIERYNGCPFCGSQFQTSHFVFEGQGSKLEELHLFTPDDMEHLFLSLLTSPVPLDATQKDSLTQLLPLFNLPEKLEIPIKETAMLVVKTLIEEEKAEDASYLLTTPTDVLRYLWYEKTGYSQLIEPKTLIRHAGKLYSHQCRPLDQSVSSAEQMKKKLKLHYDRKACRRAAIWMNQLPMTARQAAENMHSKRGMWVRFIRALRLGEYARKKGFEQLAELLDVFYKQNYTTWQGEVDRCRLKNDKKALLALLQSRPGLFARCLFATMLRLGAEEVLEAFDQIADQLPSRLLLSLGNAAEAYFDPSRKRIVRPITGVSQTVEPNSMLMLYSEAQRKNMVNAIMKVYQTSMFRRFQTGATESKSMYIDPMLYSIPISVGDRSTTLQDTSCALMGTRFPVEGNAVRLFMQWGKGLPAQHLDMDLSCRIAYRNGKTQCCYYGHLACRGAKHSGDIRSIPAYTGTAEYIELDLACLEELGASYVTFTCNAYSNGAISPNLTVGWMSSENPMSISESSGVAYDPSCVQHKVRISESNLEKGLVFGVLDVAKREIIWLEMPFTAQTIHEANQEAIEALLGKLSEKLSIGELLEMKAHAQNLVLKEHANDADESYTYRWAINPAEVCKLLFV